MIDAPEQAAALHEAGSSFDLILADPNTAKAFATVLAGAGRWHGAQVVGLDDIASLIEPQRTAA